MHLSPQQLGMASDKPPKLLIANRGEIALRIIRSARALSIPTVSIYTLVDASSPHVLEAEESYVIGDGSDPRGYLNIDGIVKIIQKSRATMVAPGYGFLSENAAFATAVEALGVTFLGPTPTQMTSMGLKHEARAVAIKAGVPVVPGSEGAVSTLDNAVKVARDIGYPILVKASGGGGGMGMQVCKGEQDLIDNFDATKAKGQSLFKEPTVFIEKFIIHARHVEVQIFGNGEGHVVHMGERECSVQRRHQKVIEEAPCVLFGSDMGKDVRKLEFVLDIDSPDYDFYFLELNARIQVEHAITEVTHPGLDLVALMIRQGLSPNHSLPPSDLRQEDYIHFEGHSIEARIYCENPKANFKPCPGQLHEIVWADVGEKGRIDTWVKTGTIVTPHYDPMIAKVVVYGDTREEAVYQMLKVLDSSKIIGPTTNLDYCKTILRTEAFKKGSIHTTFLDTFSYFPSAIEILTPGLSTTVQDLPGRFIGLGIPRGGAADMLALQAANVLVGNDRTTEGLEMTMMGAKLLFHVNTIVAITGCETDVTLDGEKVERWSSLRIKAGQTLRIGTAKSSGLRSYLAVRGGIHNISSFEGSKSTFTGAALGGYQGRALLPGDLLAITPSSPDTYTPQSWPSIPKYGNVWGINVCQGPQWDEEFIAFEGMKTLLESQWKVTPASNRSGLRLEGPRVKWARKDGGEGGGHPSNVIDQGYPFAALNMNGDTPVLFGVDAPDMGGFSCVLTVCAADLWKLGQIRPGDMIRFAMIDPTDSEYLLSRQQQWLNSLQSPCEWVPSCDAQPSSSIPSTSILHQDQKPDGSNVSFRTAGDRFILYEVGAMALDLSNRVRVELWDRAMRAATIKGVINYNVAVRSSMVQFDPSVIARDELLRIMIEKDKELKNTEDVQLDITTWKFPVVVDDRWCREAVEFYMKTARKEAVYLPNNVEYLAKNNGLPSTAVFDALTKTPWLVLARGFFVMLPFIIPLDPRHRLVAQKYNPSRTRTPEGAVGLAGVIGAIYPIESAGGYQLLGRTLTPWNAWAEKKCLLNNFDQIEFYPVSEDEFMQLERSYKAGSLKPESSKGTFNMSEYLKFMVSHEKEVEEFKKKQKEASEFLVEKEEAMFAEYAAENEKLAAAGHQKTEGVEEGLPIASPLPASVYKILVKPGDTIKSDEQNLVELEAMKTSVFVHAGEGMSGKRVAGVRVIEGDSVNPGDALVYLE
ncbi:urea carboxylase [Cryptococcus neoformans Tu259-1]|uniref:Urea carboxylase n=1 Tax=Cryptococcus neoformans Tu259-1 TaxID=1230072 RepID=A0A854Q5R2_CRYNE|nr:urea carboxylase [Cryptococcus neoformans var. grubii AD1-83a]OXG14442.1 urea carboxylase [Cryptococcus neoformans var. grubii Tu259-1]OXG44329.1 urea carboxylase [Cryptococcus neoformans var. grubii MW-RSA1955]OXG48127.1 urea carboxylase [Cryptococcus neoformans var. grubii CHC193]OXG59474.1 urea carboxylase [Cryptococcus neoformans var. grubii c8]OXH01186.1 urea carboxylase [Cryptococcus neoformans var. grubii A5-35-17]OXH02372.1 urea carboxylase [Cryptococcus neoformans var. grubii A1-3